MKKSQATNDGESTEKGVVKKDVARRKTPRERILEKERTKTDLKKSQDDEGDGETIENVDKKQELNNNEQKLKREKTRLDLKSQETQKTRLDFKNQETQTRDQEKSKSDLKRKEENENKGRLQTIKDVSPRREKSKIERRNAENESHPDKVEHKEVSNKRQQNLHDNNKIIKDKQIKEDPIKESSKTKGNEPFRNNDPKVSKKEIESQKEHKHNNMDKMDRPKEDNKFNKRDKDKKNINESKSDLAKDENLNGMKGNQKPKARKGQVFKEEDDENNFDSAAETDNDVSFVLDNKTGTNSKESSSNSFTKITPINKDQPVIKASKKDLNEKSTRENKEKNYKVEKSFNENKAKPKSSRDPLSNDKLEENSHKNEIPSKNKKRQFDGEDDDADEFEPKPKVNNNKFKDNPLKDKQFGMDTNKPNTNKNTGFQANSKRDPIKEALSENSKNSMAHQRDQEKRENPKPKKSDHIETQTVFF